MLITSRVRKATPADLPELMEMCRELHLENAQFAMNDAKVTEMIHRAFNGKGAVIGVLGSTGTIEGAILLLINSWWYTDEYCLEEIFSYVRPAYRKSTNAKELITFGKRCSDELGIPLVIGVVSNERTRAKVGLYTRQLSEPAGAYFIYGKTLKQDAKTA
jgi:hypothetical protein